MQTKTVYWFNHETGESSWTEPPELAAAKAKETAGLWQEHTDEKTKRAYWFNHETGETSWEKPAAAAGASVPVPEKPAAAEASAAQSGTSASQSPWQE